MREELANLIGVRVGLAVTEARVDTFIDDAAPDMEPDPNSGVRMRAERFEKAAFLALRGTGDPWTSMGSAPRFTAWLQMAKRTDLYAYAYDEIHRHVHMQNLGSDAYDHPYDPQRCSVQKRIDHYEGDFVVLGMLDAFAITGRIHDLDEQALLGQSSIQHGHEVRNACQILLAAYRCQQRLTPWSRVNRASAENLLDLQDLFHRSDAPACRGEFFDQRFIDFLCANIDELPHIHWRQFERLTAEYLRRQGYYVELGPGANDDGVDIRMWPVEDSREGPPLVIVQCKRRQRKLGKIIVKALWADVQANGASRGLVATTSSLSRGAARTIDARGYGIDVADGHAVEQWLKAMRSPGTGVFLV